MRLEHWTNATEQGVHAARRLLAATTAEPFAPVPFVWSDQYDRKIQTVGVVSADADVHVAHGSLAERQFVALFGRDGRIVGALGFNRPRQVMQYRRLIAERAVVGRRALRARERMSAEPDDATQPRLLTPRFMLVVTCGLCYFLALAMLTPVLPALRRGVARARQHRGRHRGRRVRGRRDLLRPFAGRIGDRVGRRVLIIGGALIVAVSTLVLRRRPRALVARRRCASSPASARPAFFVGAATMITDLAPVERRGEAV